MKTAIEQFFQSKAYGVVGVSRNSRKFGNAVFREMKKKGLAVFPVSKYLGKIEDAPCCARIADLPVEVESVVVVVHPQEATSIVSESHKKGIKNIWLQQGAESDEAIAYAEAHGMNLIHGQCILMFAEPVKSFHAFHRWINRLVGTYPR